MSLNLPASNAAPSPFDPLNAAKPSQSAGHSEADPVWRQRLRPWITWGLYPLILLGAILAWATAKAGAWPLSSALLVYSFARFFTLFACEFLFPARQEWGMSWASLLRDLKYAIVNGFTMKAVRLGVAALAIDASQWNLGLIKGLPLWLEVVVILLTYEFFQYWVHRICHEAPGTVGRFLWRIHAAHHLPTGVYLVMHPVGHPLNVLLVMLVNVPLILLGASGDALFFFNALMGLQGLVSHLNVDLRTGPLNYLLVGTELHRYHHSACLEESKNYGAITPFWDLMFGTFIYRPGVLPQRLGISEPENYPLSGQLLKVLALPFENAGRGNTDSAKQ